MGWFESEIGKWLVLPILIFLARIVDVSIGTIRIIMVSRNQKLTASLLGFFEVLIWLVAIGQIMQNLSNVACYVAYGAGFATGTLVGMYIEEKLALGVVIVRTITRRDASELICQLQDRGYGTTYVPAKGLGGDVDIIFNVIPRSNVEEVVELIKSFHPRAFYSIEDVKAVSMGIFPDKIPINKRLIPKNKGRKLRKGK